MTNTPWYGTGHAADRSEQRTSRRPGENDESKLVADVAFNRHSMNDGHHVSPFDNGTVQVGLDGIEVKLVQGLDEDAFKRTLSAATRATIGMDLSQTLPGEWEHCAAFEDWVMGRIRNGQDYQQWAMPDLGCGHSDHVIKESIDKPTKFAGKAPFPDWEEMMKGGLQTALETQVIVFAVKGVSRTCTHQLVRSRKASFHQQSQRASYFGDNPEMRMPESIWQNVAARDAFLRSALEAHKAYRVICDQDISYQDARFVLPEGTTGFIMLEYSVREFLNVYQYRACSMFQWEIVEVMRQCKAALVDAHPFLEPYIKISCEKTGPVEVPLTHVRRCTCGTAGKDHMPLIDADCEIHGPAANLNQATEVVEHHCTFQGWEDVEGQCDFKWARHEARTFKPEHHRITRTDKS